MSYSCIPVSSTNVGSTTNLYGYSPFTVVFQTSSYKPNNIISTITYSITGASVPFSGETEQWVETYKRNYTYVPLSALDPNQLDSRNNFSYTFYNNLDGNYTYTVDVSVFLIPSFVTETRRFLVVCQTPFLTKNPLMTAGINNYTFEGVHLVKNRVWGQNNEQILTLQGTLSSTNINQLFLINTVDQG